MANWIQGAVRHPGSFRALAKKHGRTTHEEAEEDKNKGGKIGKKANLALTLMKMHKH